MLLDPPALSGVRNAQRRPTRNAIEHPLVDFLFALAFICLFSGVEFLWRGVKFGPAIIFTVPLFALYFPAMCRRRAFFLLSPALLIFLAVHVASAFGFQTRVGSVKGLQAITVLALVWPFVLRYAHQPMARFYRYYTILLIAMTAYCVIWHLGHGFYVGWKRLDEPKTCFVIMPLVLMIISARRDNISKRFLSFLTGLCATLVVLSGERKAYILLALFGLFSFDARRFGSWTAPVILSLGIGAAAMLDSSGYVGRQIGSLNAADITETQSNSFRKWTTRIAVQEFLDHPISGVGTNGFMASLRSSYLRQGATIGNVRILSGSGNFLGVGIHGEFLRVATENGLVGLIPFVFLNLAAIWMCLQRSLLGRARSSDEIRLSIFFWVTCVVYISLEAFDTLSLVVICLLPYIAYLRLDPKDNSMSPRSGFRPNGLKAPPLRPVQSLSQSPAAPC